MLREVEQPTWREMQQARELLSVNRRILSQGGCEDGNTRLHPECTEVSAKWVCSPG